MDFRESGDEMSSILMPPTVGASILQNFVISSEFVASMATGIAFTSPISLRSRHLPSRIGMDASGPTFPMPSTALPLETIARRFPQLVEELEKIYYEALNFPDISGKTFSISINNITGNNK